ncbi:MAG: GreA/GreB family elongation factor [Flavobacteriaceae bacterium]|nr:GreA/GreB family elongation factor [Flavobacteriaceae bacterium]
MKIKQQLHLKCQELLQDRLRVLEKSMNDIYNNLESETKSTAGDKHETGRAMLHLEREKLGHQLAIINNQLQVFNKINLEAQISRVVLGSLVYTTQANYFISVSMGELKAGKIRAYAISPMSPVGQALMLKAVDETVFYNNQKIKILKIS